MAIDVGDAVPDFTLSDDGGEPVSIRDLRGRPALLFFYYSLNGSPVGVEIAIIFLIFTSMAWNIAFGVYEALTTLPHDLQEAATVFGVRDWLRFRRLFFPATIPRLVYNAMLSWTVGWFYLVASEYIASGPISLSHRDPHLAHRGHQPGEGFPFAPREGKGGIADPAQHHMRVGD